MSNAKLPPGRDTLPKTGKVNEVCQEWMVREDSALAYRLQNEEFHEHLSGNKFRNALVREDFPKAKDEQLREQRMAEQAAAIYQKMLQEQEELDNQVARELAEKLEREEQLRRRVAEMRDEDIARQLMDRERKKGPPPPPKTGYSSPHKPAPSLPPKASMQSPHRPNSSNYHANSPRRQAMAMPLPQPALEDRQFQFPSPSTYSEGDIMSAEFYNEPYTAPVKPVIDLSDELDRIDIASDIGVPVDELTEREIQERRDAELARQLQEQEGSLEDSLINRDRMLAIEAQDKELAKLLQERERAKAKRARERAKQKALAKKQQQERAERSIDQLLPDDAYQIPADMVLPSSVPRHVAAVPDMYAVPNPNEEDINYSLPADVLLQQHIDSSAKMAARNYNGEIKEINTGANNNYPSGERNGMSPARPNQLDLRSPLNRISKPRYPDPVDTMTAENVPISPLSPATTNIAMAIDPTYPRRGGYRSPGYDTNSSTVTTSTSSSTSPGMVLPSPLPADLDELIDDENPAPPYMPIQGQRRTSSLEKKSKKKNKDGGCKQQ